MRDFPQELVDQVIDELYDLVGASNDYPPPSGRYRRSSSHVHGIADYSLVSRAWVGPTQKHHFNTLRIYCPSLLYTWRKRIRPDPTGVSRLVRKLSLEMAYYEDLEKFGEHLRALTRVKCLTFESCMDALHHPSLMEWFLTTGSSLVELRINDSLVSPQTIASLLAQLPLLYRLEIIDFDTPDDANDTKPPDPLRIPFFEGRSCFAWHPRHNRNYPESSLEWIPPSARFARLEVDMTSTLGQLDLVDRWLASSCTTLTSLAILPLGDHIPLRPLDLSPCTALESLQIPICASIEIFLSRIASTRLAKVIFNSGRFWPAVGLGDIDVDVVENYLCPLAKRFNEAHPGRQMEVGIAGEIGRGYRRNHILRVLNDRMFMPTLKKEARFVIPPAYDE